MNKKVLLSFFSNPEQLRFFPEQLAAVEKDGGRSGGEEVRGG